MMGKRSYPTVILTFALTGFGAACAHVGQEKFDAEIASLRSEFEESDRRVGRRTDERMVELSARLDGLTGKLAAFQGDFDVAIERLETAIRFNVPVYFAFDEATPRRGGSADSQPVHERCERVLSGSPAYGRRIHRSGRLHGVQSAARHGASRDRSGVSDRVRRFRSGAGEGGELRRGCRPPRAPWTGGRDDWMAEPPCGPGGRASRIPGGRHSGGRRELRI